ncbi:MAG: MarR family transcriptional regulator [Bacteroidota bacterium]
MNTAFTKKQGQYLVFIYYYQKLNKVAPAFADFERYFNASPASVNDMIKTLVRKELISKERGKARSIRLLVGKEVLPELE